MATENQQQPIRVGVVGLGRSGYGIHLKAFKGLTDRFTVAAVADTNTERAQEVAAEFGCDALPDIDALTARRDVELIVVSTTNNLHGPHSVKALNAGKHVVCEKPFGVTVAEVDAMMAAAKEAGRVLTPFQNRRYEPAFQKLREILKSGRLGRIVQIRMASHGFGRRWDWQTLEKYAGGQLNNNGPHSIDQALVLFDDFGVSDPDRLRVFSSLTNAMSSGDKEDHVRISMRAPGVPDAPVIDIEITAASPYPQDHWHVMGTAGGLRGSGSKLEWKWVDWESMPPRPVDERSTPDRSYNRETLIWQEDSCEVSADFATWANTFYGDVFATIRCGAEQVITPADIRKRIRLIEMVREAAA